MALENKSEILTWEFDPLDSNPKETSFELVLDSACERLWEKQVQLSIRRITAMEEKLSIFEKELDEFLGMHSKESAYE